MNINKLLLVGCLFAGVLPLATSCGNDTSKYANTYETAITVTEAYNLGLKLNEPYRDENDKWIFDYTKQKYYVKGIATLQGSDKYGYSEEYKNLTFGFYDDDSEIMMFGAKGKGGAKYATEAEALADVVEGTEYVYVGYIQLAFSGVVEMSTPVKAQAS